MTIAFPAFHQTLLPGAHTPAAVAAAMQRAGWTLVQQNEDRITGKVGLNLWSFGETVTATLADGRVTLRSACVLPTQCFDWGKNRRNVDALARALRG